MSPIFNKFNDLFRNHLVLFYRNPKPNRDSDSEVVIK